MGVLKYLFLLLLIISCSESTNLSTDIKLRNDTYISSKSSKDFTQKKVLRISKSSNLEERILLRLPSSDEGDDFFEKCFKESDLCSIFFLPIKIVTKILSTCDSLNASNLTTAILTLNTTDDTDIAANSITMKLLGKGWWQTVNWKKAHPFSEDGEWSTPGGDMLDTVTFEKNCNNLSTGTCSSGEIKFEVTDYFRGLLNEENLKHYGLILYANNDLAAKTIHSVQAKHSKSPRITATYTCTNGFISEEQTKTFYLGSPIN